MYVPDIHVHECFRLPVILSSQIYDHTGTRSLVPVRGDRSTRTTGYYSIPGLLVWYLFPERLELCQFSSRS